MIMRLNNIAPIEGSKKQRTRVGRGIGSGFGKTCGRGHKGQKSRSGGFHKTGFEGGQMPIQRRLPKRGFVPLPKASAITLRISDLGSLKEETITIETLKKHNLIPSNTKSVKIYKSGNLDKKLSISGIKVSHGVKKMIEVSGGSFL